jgi:hypothetical protein
MALSILAAPALARAEDPVRPMRYPPTSVRWKLITGGILITGVAYGIGFLAATQWSDAPGAKDLKIPVAGPWIAFANNGCPSGDCGAMPYVRGVLEVLSGIAQAGGMGLVGEGIFMTTESNRAPGSRADSARVTLRPVPVVGAEHAGIGLVASF